MTVNSFAAVSLEPALVLWSIQNTSDCFDQFTQCDRYGISVLQRSQEALSNRYARSMDHQVEASDLIRDEQGTPLISSALATFSCRTNAIHAGGDHHIIVGEVEAFTSVDGEPLFVLRRRLQKPCLVARPALRVPQKNWVPTTAIVSSEFCAIDII